jgi:uncharacterized membrane protein YqjE
MSGERSGAGLFDSLRAMLATLITLAHTRLELLTVEIQEEVHRVAMTLLWSVVGVFTAGLGVLLLALTVVIAFWETHRLLAAGAVTALFLGVALASILVVRRRLATRSGLLSHSIDELRRDAEALRGRP